MSAQGWIDYYETHLYDPGFRARERERLGFSSYGLNQPYDSEFEIDYRGLFVKTGLGVIGGFLGDFLGVYPQLTSAFGLTLADYLMRDKLVESKNAPIEYLLKYVTYTTSGTVKVFLADRFGETLGRSINKITEIVLPDEDIYVKFLNEHPAVFDLKDQFPNLESRLDVLSNRLSQDDDYLKEILSREMIKYVSSSTIIKISDKAIQRKLKKLTEDDIKLKATELASSNRIIQIVSTKEKG